MDGLDLDMFMKWSPHLAWLGVLVLALYIKFSIEGRMKALQQARDDSYDPQKGFVTVAQASQDRRAQRDALTRIEGKVDNILAKLAFGGDNHQRPRPR